MATKMFFCVADESHSQFTAATKDDGVSCDIVVNLSTFYTSLHYQ